MIVSQPRETLWAWLNTRVPAVGWTEDFRAIGLVRDDCLIAVAGYNWFVGKTCHVHIAADDKRIPRSFVRAGFEYAFRQLDLVSVFAWMDPAKPHPLDIDYRLGFSDALRVPGGTVEGNDLILIQLNRADCKWLRASA